MNRMLLTAVAALGMAVSGNAIAATYTLDSFEGTNSMFNAVDPFDNGVTISPDTSLSSTAGSLGSYTSSGFTFSRDIMFAQTGSTPFDSVSSLYITGADQDDPQFPAHYAAAFIQNNPGVNSTVALTYNISAIDATVGNNQAVFNLSMISSDAGLGQDIYVDAYLNGSATAFDTWTISNPVQFFMDPATNHQFSVLGSSLTGVNDQISFVVHGASGFNATLAPVTFDVLPVPEVGMLPMFGTGLLAVGFAARRKRRAAQL